MGKVMFFMYTAYILLTVILYVAVQKSGSKKIRHLLTSVESDL